MATYGFRTDASGNFAAITSGTEDVMRFGGDNSGQLAGFRNKLINCNFEINQLNVSGTVTLAAGQYGHDGFKGGAAGCTYTFSTVGGITTLTITAGTLVQIANGKYLKSGIHTLGWNGTAQGRIDTGAYAVSPIAGTAVAGVNQSCEWGIGTLSLPQYEPGSIRTQFEFRDDELARCQRYFYKITEFMRTDWNNHVADDCFLSWPLPVCMNGNPASVWGGTTDIPGPSLVYTTAAVLQFNSAATPAGTHFLDLKGCTFSARL